MGSMNCLLILWQVCFHSFNHLGSQIDKKKRFVFLKEEGGKKLFNLGKKTFHLWLNKSNQQFPWLLYWKIERLLERNKKIREGLVGKKLLKVFYPKSIFSLLHVKSTLNHEWLEIDHVEWLERESEEDWKSIRIIEEWKDFETEDGQTLTPWGKMNQSDILK